MPKTSIMKYSLPVFVIGLFFEIPITFCPICKLFRMKAISAAFAKGDQS
jgi:hypothetical protein